MKVCSKCGEEKPLSEFGKLKESRDGLNYKCKQCCREYFNDYYKNNTDIYRKIRKKYNSKQEVKDRVNELRKISYSENPQKYREKSKKWRELNIDKAKYTVNNYRIKNKDKCIELNKKWFENNPDYSKKWWKSDSGIRSNVKRYLTEKIGDNPPQELIEVKLLINKTKKLCKTLNN